MPGGPNCYACKHRCLLPGDAHSSCAHPEADVIGLIQIMAYGYARYRSGLEVSGEPHGVVSGWFMWPVNYDPLWLNSCNGFAPKEGGS